MSDRILLVVGTVVDDPQHTDGGRRFDQAVLRDALGADVVDLSTVRRLPGGQRLAQGPWRYVTLTVATLLRVLRRPPGVVLCDSENVALLLALALRVLRRPVPLATVGIDAGQTRKRLLIRWADRHIDLWLPLGSVQAERLLAAGVPAGRVRVLPYWVDTRFYSPGAATRVGGRPLVLAVGRQHRDFATLVDAVAELPVDVLVAAGSLYSSSRDSLAGRALPDNVTVTSLGYAELRQAYRDAAVVVLPTVESEFAPGLTALVEAMATGRPVVYSRAEGNGDVLADRRRVLRSRNPRPTRGVFAATHAADEPDAAGPHGLYVPVGDAATLRAAVDWLLQHPEQADEMGRRGRALACAALDLDHHVRRVQLALQGLLDRRKAEGTTPQQPPAPQGLR